MERQRMMETTKRQSYGWWFGSHNNNPARSQWLNSTLSDLDEKTKAMLRIIEEDADSFSQRAEMYYKKRPQLVAMVEDFYRAHRSLAEQFDHLRHEPRTNPLARSFPHSISPPEKKIDPLKSYDGSFTKLAYDSDDLLTPLSKVAGRYNDSAYDSDSEVDDPDDSTESNHDDLTAEMERLSEEVMEKDKTIEELKLKLSESAIRAPQVMEKQKEAMKNKDEEKREAIRQMSLAIEMMKDENRALKKMIAYQTNKRWNPFESSQVFKGLGKLFNCTLLSSNPTVVPL